MVNLSPWHLPIWHVSKWNCYKLLVFLFHNSSPQLTEATGRSHHHSPDLRSLLVKAAARAGAWKEALLLSEGIESWIEDSALLFITCGLGASVGPLYLLKRQILVFCKTVKTPRYVSCCSDFKTFSNLEKCFTDSSIWGSAESLFFLSSRIWFVFTQKWFLCYFQDALKPMTAGCGVSTANFTSFLMSREEI